MALTNEQKQKISIEVIKTLVTRFEKFPEDATKNRNAPFHEEFLKAFADKLEGKVTDIPVFVSLSSWLHGLNTTLGQSFFENVAHTLCSGEKREYTSKKLGNLSITQTQRDNISNIIANLSNKKSQPNIEFENNQIFQNFNTPIINALDFSADVFFEEEDSVIAIELKTVNPNSSGNQVEKQKILEGKAALYRLFPNKKIFFYLGFPFDPTLNPKTESVTGYDKKRYFPKIVNLTKFFAEEEILVASELWDFLSGQANTMKDILEIINTISTTDFLYKFQLLSDNSRRLTPEYKAQLNEWNLFSEIELINNNSIIVTNIGTDKILTRIYNKTAFDNKGNYNTDRFVTLRELM